MKRSVILLSIAVLTWLLWAGNQPLTVKVDEAPIAVEANPALTASIDAISIPRLISYWSPDSERGYIVDLQDYQETAAKVAKFFNNSKVRLDHWNAAAIESKLSSDGIETERKNVGYNEYTKAKSVIYSGNLVLPNPRIQGGLSIRLRTSNREEKTSLMYYLYGRQDLCDAVVHVIDMLYESHEVEEMVIGYPVGYSSQSSGQELEKTEAEELFGLKRGYGFNLYHKKQEQAEDDDTWGIVI